MASWSTSGNTQQIPNDTMLNAIGSNLFAQKSTIPQDKRVMTKQRANEYVWINTAHSSYAAKASNQLVAKQDLVSNVGTYTAYYHASSCDQACNIGTATTVYTYDLAIDGTLWGDSNLFTPAADGYYRIGSTCYYQSTPVTPCGSATTYSGGPGFASYTITLGSGTGTVNLSFTAYTIPDRWRVIWNGEEVINTGFRGDSSYNAALNAAGFPSVVGGGSGNASFYKLLSSPTTAIVYIDAPLTNTAWEFTLSCPT